MLEFDLYNMAYEAGGDEVLWDYCLENDIAMPCHHLLLGNQSERVADIHDFGGYHSGTGRSSVIGFEDHHRSTTGAYRTYMYPWSLSGGRPGSAWSEITSGQADSSMSSVDLRSTND